MRKAKIFIFSIFWPMLASICIYSIQASAENSEINEIFTSEQASIVLFQQQSLQDDISTPDLNKLYNLLTEKQRLISNFRSAANPYHGLKLADVLALTQSYNDLRDSVWKIIEGRKTSSNKGQRGSVQQITEDTVHVPETIVKLSDDKWADLSKIVKSLSNLDANYGDVPSRINCYRPKNKAQQLICTDTYLTIAELFYSRYSVYEWENGTKREVDHKGFKIELPNDCTDKQCIYNFFKEAAYRQLDENSPYETGALQNDNFAGHFVGRGEGNLELVVRAKGNGYEATIMTGTKNECSGRVSGPVTKLGANAIRLSTRDGDSERLCRVTMVYQDDKIMMTSKDCSDWHGMACDFVGKLSRK